MEDPTSTIISTPTETASPFSRGLSKSLSEQRRQIEEFLASRRERMDGVESQLNKGLAQIVEELVRLRSEAKSAGEELQSREARLEQENEQIEQMRSDLDAARTALDESRAEWDESRRETEKQHTLLLEQIQQHQQEQQQQHQVQLEEMAQRQSALDEAREALERERERQPESNPDDARKLNELQSECNELRRNLEERPQATGDIPEEIERLTSERDAAVRNLEETERLLAEAENKLVEAANGGEGSDGSEYKQRYKLSLEDIRQLKKENKELAEALSQAKSRTRAAGGSSGSAAGALSWEAQKQQLLASLENGYDENDPEDAQQRMQIEDVVKRTELAISQKDDEIKELKKLLEDQSENIGTVAVGAAAFGEILDNDQIIQEERESLKKLQEEMRQKLSAAEIELSVERAKIARQLVQIEEKTRQLAQYQPSETSGNKSQTDEQVKPSRGRWLSRLGLSDIEE
ncbi:MAG: hypothetical protein JXM70_05735 [Pirellulales bacterium]|nr:hypothetical protein [Pirellulales bacterium]